ncbi:hypothetical protein HG549_12825 [Pseudomonas sp. SK]|uniref:hypothetical protein n=1 Tax=Pseudomonas sp. SK TaxID=2729423 RepID=UPI001464222B|nr:hypothetical protein [Pseudomonas sp. SK]QJQ20770.1 hypothetical protein HG549_12825 [Pseudomonas sp. SK]
MKGNESSDLQNKLSVTASPFNEARLDTLSGEDDGEVRSTEWARFCLRHRAVGETSEITCARVELPQIDGPAEIRIAASFSGGKQMRCALFTVPAGEIEPLPVTSRQMGVVATFRGGYALLLRIPDDLRWAHDVWPTSMDKLDAFVAKLTEAPSFLETWVMNRNRQPNKLLIVVVIHGNVFYGFLLGSPKTEEFSNTRVIPIFFEQVGEFTYDPPVLIELELSAKHLEALITHARQLLSEPDHAQEDRHLRDALGELANALEGSANRSRST